MNNVPVMTEAEKTAYLQYMADVKKSIKHYSKNDLIRTVAALLVDKQVLQGIIERLQAPKAEDETPA